MGDDFVAGSDAQGHEGEPEGISAVADTDGELSAVIGSEFGLELLEHGAHDVLAALQDRPDILINFVFDIMVLTNMTVE